MFRFNEVFFRVSGKSSDLKTHEQRPDDQLVDHAGVHLEQDHVRVREPDEEEPPKDVAPDVDGFVRPPEHALQAELGGQDGPVAAADERVELEVGRGVVVAK